jgi:predicted lipoprotein with Yx(FWY)xxD motif
MKTPTILMAASALATSACATYSTAPVAPMGAATVTTATKPPFGTYLVDGAGRALYVLDGERGMTTSRCTGACLGVWPPLLAAGPATAAAGVDARRLATVNVHGRSQVTYSGWPLYYYHRDRIPADTTGQYVRDTWGTWYLLSPSGEPIRPSGGY